MGINSKNHSNTKEPPPNNVSERQVAKGALKFQTVRYKHDAVLAQNTYGSWVVFQRECEFFIFKFVRNTYFGQNQRTAPIPHELKQIC